MYLILKGKKPKPICRVCHKPGPEGYEVRAGYIYLCLDCVHKAAAGALTVPIAPWERREAV